MLGTSCTSNPVFGCPSGNTINPRIATPPAPPIEYWTKAPGSQQEADALVQYIANQEMIAQQAVDASGVKSVAEWVPSFLVPNPKSNDSSSSDIPWGTYLLLGGIITLAIVLR